MTKTGGDGLIPNRCQRVCGITAEHDLAMVEMRVRFPPDAFKDPLLITSIMVAMAVRDRPLLGCRHATGANNVDD